MFIAKWRGVAASELSTSQSFLIDLSGLLGPAARADQTPAEQGRIAATEDANDNSLDAIAIPAAAKPLPWPKDTVDQVRAVADVIASSPVPLTVDAIAARFTARGPWKRRLPKLLEMLVALGRAQDQDGMYVSV
ncbi:hypothetical protein CMZ84_09940 [Lysobacteraceae bacterium NML93-0399]|nr:hypothetical protein CMZ84_09940 [Xanthomonadaceae bacterium NML93-0399]